MKKPSRTKWEEIDSLKDEEIDYSDNPKLDAGFFARAVRWPGNKELISLRLDPDVLAFFKKQGKGYQTTINSLLRKYMEAQTTQVAGNAFSGTRRKLSNAARKKLADAIKRSKRNTKSA